MFFLKTWRLTLKLDSDHTWSPPDLRGHAKEESGVQQSNERGAQTADGQHPGLWYPAQEEEEQGKGLGDPLRRTQGEIISGTFRLFLNFSARIFLWEN